jgi:hypothetical protein
MWGCLGKPVTWSKFKKWSYLYQLKVYELRMKTQFIISLFKPEIQHVECRWSVSIKNVDI